jgi:hypothetical protein
VLSTRLSCTLQDLGVRRAYVFDCVDVSAEGWKQDAAKG